MNNVKNYILVILAGIAAPLAAMLFVKLLVCFGSYLVGYAGCARRCSDAVRVCCRHCWGRNVRGCYVRQDRKAKMKLRNNVNKHGTPITVFQCEYCGCEFTICPVVPDIHLDRWKGCMGPNCPSYEEGRDVDRLIEEGFELVKTTKH